MSFGGMLYTCTTHFQCLSSGDELVEDFIKYITEDRKMSASTNSDSENT